MRQRRDLEQAFDRAMREPKPKDVKYEQIDIDKEREPFELLNEALEDHDDLCDAVIGLAWRRDWTANADGQVILGKCQKASDLARQFQHFDFVIILNRDVWYSAGWTREKKLAVIDHELCHATVAVDGEGDPKMNSQGRPVFRVRKHDIEEFREVIDRHGCFKSDLVKFAESIMHNPPAQLNLPMTKEA